MTNLILALFGIAMAAFMALTIGSVLFKHSDALPIVGIMFLAIIVFGIIS